VDKSSKTCVMSKLKTTPCGSGLVSSQLKLSSSSLTTSTLRSRNLTHHSPYSFWFYRSAGNQFFFRTYVPYLEGYVDQLHEKQLTKASPHPLTDRKKDVRSSGYGSPEHTDSGTKEKREKVTGSCRNPLIHLPSDLPVHSHCPLLLHVHLVHPGVCHCLGGIRLEFREICT